FFFFSSRRRHTRWPRDWSSDVCSSDLGLLKFATLIHLTWLSRTRNLSCMRWRPVRWIGVANFNSPAALIASAVPLGLGSATGPRSEERRVGKGWRSGLWGEEEKENEGQ